MELQILISKKGTRVITATNLHLALELSSQSYAANIKRWINDVYLFNDGIRRPIPLKDFAKRKIPDNAILQDFYISLEFAKLITLNSGSKVKLKWAQWLQSMEEKERNDNLVTQEEVITAMELAKAMSYGSYQLTCERQHLKVYESRNGGSAANWWKHRWQVVGYTIEDLRDKMRAMEKDPGGKSYRQILKQIDGYELIRTGVIDLFMALGKTDHYARKMGDLTKAMAKKLNIKLVLEEGNMETLQPYVNSSLINKVLEMEQKNLVVAQRA